MTDANQEYSLGGFGARLKTAREALNLSQKDAAVRLHLNVNILQILESENFDKAPPATFMRGYLRSYARLLNFSEEEINTALTESGLESQTSPLVDPATLQVETMRVNDRYVQWASTAVVLGLFVFVGVWWGLHSSGSKPTLVRSAAPAASPPPPQIVQPAAPPAVVPPAAVPNTATAPETPAIQSASPPPSPPPPASKLAAEPAAAPPSNTAVPFVTPPPNAIPGNDLLATPAEQSNTQVASSDDTPKKHKHHRQDNHVSGLSMALPEPGL
ncbi:MAG TPA: helix-turn-helix domain-containing protein [Gammaproteobacteria bacterium]|nr:helix-turn-helix domain-containing protein [Gammaproteobacteria bacterium]